MRALTVSSRRSYNVSGVKIFVVASWHAPELLKLMELRNILASTVQLSQRDPSSAVSDVECE